MKKKVNLTIDENLHKKMKKIALNRDKYVFELYEEALSDFIKKTKNQLTLDEIK